MPKLTLQDWDKDFRKPAKADRYDTFHDHMRFLELPGEPITMMRATILMVHASTAYYEIDGRAYDDFLVMQQYNPAKWPHARYAFAFGLCGKACALLLVDSEIHAIDLADLYGHPWEPHRTVGYSQIWISHTDWTDLTKEEIEVLCGLVTDDLRYDYTEEELDFWFDDSNAKYLHVYVQDHDEPDDENEK